MTVALGRALGALFEGIRVQFSALTFSPLLVLRLVSHVLKYLFKTFIINNMLTLKCCVKNDRITTVSGQ